MIRQTDMTANEFNRREDRVFRRGFNWHYHIRAGCRGPFPSRQAAEDDLEQYLSTMRFIEANADTLPADLDADEITYIDIGPPQY